MAKRLSTSTVGHENLEGHTTPGEAVISRTAEMKRAGLCAGDSASQYRGRNLEYRIPTEDRDRIKMEKNPSICIKGSGAV